MVSFQQDETILMNRITNRIEQLDSGVPASKTSIRKTFVAVCLFQETLICSFLLSHHQFLLHVCKHLNSGVVLACGCTVFLLLNARAFIFLKGLFTRRLLEACVY